MSLESIKLYIVNALVLFILENIDQIIKSTSMDIFIFRFVIILSSMKTYKIRENNAIKDHILETKRIQYKKHISRNM